MPTYDDQAKLKAIFIADDDVTRVALMRAYWHDLDRAERTDRAEMYLHLGIALGMCDRLLEQLRRTQQARHGMPDVTIQQARDAVLQSLNQAAIGYEENIALAHALDALILTVQQREGA